MRKAHLRRWLRRSRGRIAALSIVDETTMQVIGTKSLPQNVSSAALNAQAGLLYFALKGEDRLALVRVRDL